jgi:hypothetical protein
LLAVDAERIIVFGLVPCGSGFSPGWTMPEQRAHIAVQQRSPAMDHLRRLTWISVARGCGFGVLAIFTTMIGFVTTPAVALDFGGFSFLLMATILILKARMAPSMSYRRTEVWLMLDEGLRPPADVAQVLIGRVRADVLLACARLSAWSAALLLALSLLLKIAGWR